MELQVSCSVCPEIQAKRGFKGHCAFGACAGEARGNERLKVSSDVKNNYIASKQNQVL